MNKIYKVIWSKVRNCYVAVSEIAKRNGKSCTSVNCGAKANRGHAGVALSAAVGATLLAGVCSVLLPVRVALAATLPTLDYKGATAYVTIDDTSTANKMSISSSKTNNVLKWVDFSIGNGGTVQFDTNNYLNYVTGHGRSEIDGTLKGTGNIYLINPNGVLFGTTAQVNVGNLYVSSRSLTTTQLNNFENSGTNPLVSTTSESLAGDIINLGKLNATNITVEGRNISFKNVSDVTVTGTINVRADATHSGYVHIGYANTASTATSVNNTEYTTVNEPDLSKWTIKRTDSAIEVSPIKYMLVRNKYELQNMKNNLGGNYMLAGDIDASSMSFVPISDSDTHFNGEFDGLNYKVNNLTINRPDSDYVGLFGYQGLGTIENVKLTGGSITGRD